MPSWPSSSTRHGCTTGSLSGSLSATTHNKRSNREAEVADAIGTIAALGVGLSVDGFGTGYSPLSLLRSLPVTQLKVDTLFVAGLSPGHLHDGFAAAVIGLAHQFDLTCVAEGVENEQQLGRLRDLGCDLAQGFHLGTPVTAEEFAHAYQPV